MGRRTCLALLVATLLFALGVVAAQEEKVDAFVCPVFNDDAAVGDSNPNVITIYGGDHSLLPGRAGEHGPGVDEFMSVPEGATNGDGGGSPAGPHSSPGDTDYTAVWNNELLE